jgi:hypothetical protein
VESDVVGRLGHELPLLVILYHKLSIPFDCSGDCNVVAAGLLVMPSGVFASWHLANGIRSWWVRLQATNVNGVWAVSTVVEFHDQGDNVKKYYY